MISVILEPHTGNLDVAETRLNYESTDWAERENSQNKELFLAYLDACKQVVNDLRIDTPINTDEMDEKYKELNPDE